MKKEEGLRVYGDFYFRPVFDRFLTTYLFVLIFMEKKYLILIVALIIILFFFMFFLSGALLIFLSGFAIKKEIPITSHNYSQQVQDGHSQDQETSNKEYSNVTWTGIEIDQETKQILLQKFIENEGINESRNIIIEILKDTPIAVSATAVVYPEESIRYTGLCRYYTLTMIKGVWYLESMYTATLCDIEKKTKILEISCDVLGPECVGNGSN